MSGGGGLFWWCSGSGTSSSPPRRTCRRRWQPTPLTCTAHVNLTPVLPICTARVQVLPVQGVVLQAHHQGGHAGGAGGAEGHPQPRRRGAGRRWRQGQPGVHAAHQAPVVPKRNSQGVCRFGTYIGCYLVHRPGVFSGRDWGCGRSRQVRPIRRCSECCTKKTLNRHSMQSPLRTFCPVSHPRLRAMSCPRRRGPLATASSAPRW